MVSQIVKVTNATGLHFRPAGLFCKTAVQFNSRITMRKIGQRSEVSANAKSVLGVLGACVKSGDEIELICEGDDEAEALEEMVRLVKDGLGE